MPWSLARISDVPVDDYNRRLSARNELYPQLNHADIESYVRKSGARIIERKGATYYAVTIAVCQLCKNILAGIDTSMPVSTMMNGEYGIDDVCLSVLNVVGRDGAGSKVLVPLTDEETAALRASADCLKGAISNLKI